MDAVDRLEQAFLDADLRIGVGEIDDVDAFAVADLDLVEAVGIVAGLEYDLAAAFFLETA